MVASDRPDYPTAIFSFGEVPDVTFSFLDLSPKRGLDENAVSLTSLIKTFVFHDLFNETRYPHNARSRLRTTLTLQ